MERIGLHVEIRAVQGALDRDFPDIHGTEEHLVLWGFQHLPARRIQSREP